MTDLFSRELQRHGLALPPRSVDTLQLNITRRCNQACRHCHVDASPARTERLSAEGVAACLDVLERHPQIGTLDLTGGAPELHPQFTQLVEGARALDRRVIVRHNLTVQFDGDPATKQPMDHLPAFFAQQGVEVVSSLPYYQEYFTDAQRGSGVFSKSIEALRRLNAVGYGVAGTGRVLSLVYNPVGPYLPAPQASLEADYRKALAQQFDVQFTNLFTITNMPIHRFRLHLEKSGQYAAYIDKLLAAFNPAAAGNVMCRDLISVDHRGRLYDCDFNQQLGLHLQRDDGTPETIFDFDPARLLRRSIRFGDHCLGCSAGGGSSCGGATV